MMVIAAALKTGRTRTNTDDVGTRCSHPAADTTSTPMPMSTDASPTLNALISNRP
jgi:hypothetical protein